MIVNAIIQARCGSKRLPNKLFLEIDGKPLIWHVVYRLKLSKNINNIIIATTKNEEDNRVIKWCENSNILYFRGKENDVLNRFFETSLKYPSDLIVRITADDPLKEPKVIDDVIKKLMDRKYDYVTNNYPPTFPEGFDCEVFTIETLKKMERCSNDLFEREHVTQYIFHNLDDFKIGNVSYEKDISNYRLTIDNIEDYKMIKEIYKNRIKNKKDVLLLDEILQILEKNPYIVDINKNVQRSLLYKNK